MARDGYFGRRHCERQCRYASYLRDRIDDDGIPVRARGYPYLGHYGESVILRRQRSWKKYGKKKAQWDRRR
jgi:hypothetical protein